MTKYRKKPVVIDAFKWDGTVKCLKDNVGQDKLNKFGFYLDDEIGFVPITNSSLIWHDDNVMAEIKVKTLEGLLTASKGDYIIKGVRGEYYSCKPDVFAKTYEPVKDDNTTEISNAIENKLKNLGNNMFNDFFN